MDSRRAAAAPPLPPPPSLTSDITATTITDTGPVTCSKPRTTATHLSPSRFSTAASGSTGLILSYRALAAELKRCIKGEHNRAFI
jgi:hypothetical protein